MNAITVVKKGDRHVALFRWSTEIKDRVKAAGFRFDGTRKEWWTNDAAIAASFNGAAPAPQNDYKEPDTSDIPEAGPEWFAKANLVIPAPDGLAYLPFQLDGICKLLPRKNALLADEMGLGKTIQAIGVINATPSIKRVLVICPASLKTNWKKELMTWCYRPMTIHVISPGADWQPCDIVILNYEQVAKYRSCIDRVAWDLLIADECHYLKNGKAARTQAVIGKWADAPADRVPPINATRKLWMTGTPVLNRPKELWVAVRTLDRSGLGQDWLSFHTRYCAAYKNVHGWQLDGNSNLDELQNRLRNGIMVRRKKADVLKELPAKRRQVFLLPAESADTKKMLELEKELAPVKEKLDKLRAEVEALSVNQADLAYKKAVQALEKAEGVAFSDTARVRHQTALAKLPGAIDHLANVLESESKVVVFAHHHDVIDGLMAGLADYSPVKIDGRDAPGDRQKAVEAFQGDPGVRVIIGSIGAMGVGLTLTAASYCGFVELDWVPGNMAQAEDRLHRIGQAESVLVQHIMLDGSFDGYMAATVVAKLRVIEKAVG